MRLFGYAYQNGRKRKVAMLYTFKHEGS